MTSTSATTEIAARLIETIAGYDSCLVALSAGVDSAVVAQAAALALKERAIAVTGTSASLATGEAEEAISLAARIGIAHRTIATAEFERPDYLRNAPDRCYHCKTELYTQLKAIAQAEGFAVIVNGANTDDIGDYRPGMIAAGEFAVRSPLLECGIDKTGVRALAAYWQLPVHDKPATPCLSSRVAYGQAVTPDRLAMIDAGEQWLRERGFAVVRVRYHQGDLARVEVPSDRLPQLLTAPLYQQLEARLRELGFRYITVDLSGFRSGSGNELLPILH